MAVTFWGRSAAAQCTEAIAESITAVTASGCDMGVKCEPPSKFVIVECARLAIVVSDSGVMMRVASTFQIRGSPWAR
jgi:hypothetical protein